MNKKFFLTLAVLCLSVSLFAQNILNGYHYGTETAPTGKEWESPENLALNKEQPHAYFFSFQDTESARKVLPENSSYWQSLNGDWKFHWSPNPDLRPKDFYKTDFDVSKWDMIPVPSSWNVYGIQKDGSLKYGVPIYVNQPVIFQHKVAVDDWRGGVMRTPPENWTTFNHRNEVGSFVREFNIPVNWKEREVFINFDGTDSFFYLWINGKYVGFSKNSRNLASFNITKYLQEGKNIVAVEVYRNSDASFLEAQDMFRLAGIFRTVALHSTPKTHIRDLVVMPDLDKTYTNGSLKIKADIRNFGKKEAKGYKVVYSLYQNKLYSDENTLVANTTAETGKSNIKTNENITTEVVLNVVNPQKWSAEFPYRYTLIAELKDAKNKTIETVSANVGFAKVEVKDTPASEDEFGLAGRYFYVNGKPVKLKGVNRHETNPSVGHAITREWMTDEIMVMKRGNINHVRNSHYPDAPYWYYLCDKYGIYLEDEANIESHQYYYGEASLSHPKEWESAHVARVMEMAHATVNHPSIVIWSLGNEAGPGNNFITAYNELKKFDSSRPVQYERNNRIVDIGSNQYPSIAWTREAVKGKYNIKYPFHISEYAHSMGNAAGNLVDYWEAIESTNFFCGGAIWDWIDQAIYNYDKKTGKRYIAYGGDFGDTPNDGQFVMNGIMFADLTPKPQYHEVKKVYQHIGVKALDITAGTFEVFNKYYFKDLSDYNVMWYLYENGKEVNSGKAAMPSVQARKKATITLPYSLNSLKKDAEYFVKIQFNLNNEKPWAPAGYTAAEEQILLKAATDKPLISEVAATKDVLKVTTEPLNHIIKIEGKDFTVKFDLKTGSISSLVYGNETVIADGNGPKIDAFRAFVNNDNWAYSQWFENGLHNLKHTAINSKTINQKDGTILLAFTVESQAPNGARIHGGTSSGKNRIEENTDTPFGENDFKFTTNQIWTVYPDGSIELQSSITSNKPSLALPRLGYIMKVPQKYSQFTYYGRGPIDNYNDRKTGQFIERYVSSPNGEFVPFPKPQDMGNHEEVRWCALTSANGTGVMFISNNSMSVAALQYSALDLVLTSHPFQLPPAGDTYLNLSLAVTGLGGNSCGQGPPLTQDRVFASSHNMGFIIRPMAGKEMQAVANVAPAGETPLAIIRSNTGVVEITSVNKNAEIMYTIDGKGKGQIYTESIPLRNGGSVTAWYKNNPQITVSNTFGKIESIQTEVIFASSEEISDPARNLTDGDPNTIWHTMYSVTVAKHPHWVDLDAGEVRTIKGFTYLPRQGGGNGNVKDYTIQVSTDGKNWGEPVAKGAFDRSSKEKKVMFDKPVEGRYIRFTALSEQRGQDYASGAEITILAE